ncbi:glycosyltransferase family 9 protein [Planctomycetota bacterium]
MQKNKDEILIWLPSPIGDAVLCTPALRAIRKHFSSSLITFFAKPLIREVLSPGGFNNIWLEQKSSNPFTIAGLLKECKFSQAILFKNSLGSALAAFLAGIPTRLGYARDGRGFLLTEKLYPPKTANGRLKPISMIDYYSAIASWLGANVRNRKLELEIVSEDKENLQSKLPEIIKSKGPIVVMVPGGAFGPSKCWLSERFAQTADWLSSSYKATVVVSVSPEPAEVRTAEQICRQSKCKLVNLAQRPLSIGELKALFSMADLVISNDTGPRHLTIAFERKLITLFGPNDPKWTDTGYDNEIQIVGNAPCAPCAKPVCKESKHLCMDSITVDNVCEAAKKLLGKNKKAKRKSGSS